MLHSNLRSKSILMLFLIPLFSYCHNQYPIGVSDPLFRNLTGKSLNNIRNLSAFRVTHHLSEGNPIEGRQLFNTSAVRPMVHVGLGGGDYSFTAMGVSVFRQINPTVMAGISAQYFGENGKNSLLYKWQKIPLTFESMIDLKKYHNNRSSVYMKIGVGYSFTLNGSYYDPNEYIYKKVSDGWAFNPGLGYRINFLKNTGLNFDVSYHLIIDKLHDEQGAELAKNYWNHILFRTSVFF